MISLCEREGPRSEGEGGWKKKEQMRAKKARKILFPPLYLLYLAILYVLKIKPLEICFCTIWKDIILDLKE